MVVDESHDDRTRSFVVLTAGTQISHYRIINKIGAGGMGEVYLAQDTELDRKIALKFLAPHLCQDEDCRARFKREAQAAAKLDHPNIIPVYEVSDYEGRPYFVMAHVEGRSLKEYSSGKEMTVDQVVELGIQICEGLNAAHEQGVTHRDIKPSNILIDSHGRARIVDFGLAAVKGTDQLTKAGSTMGTIGYMSPEQVRGEQADHRSDLFSLGVILYELTAGRLPFKAETEAGTMNAVLNAIPEPLSRYKTGVSGELQHTVSKLLEKDTQHRYQSAADLISDLKRLALTGEVPVAPPRPKKSIVKFLIGCVIGLALFAVVDHFLFSDEESVSRRKIMLAVLPFENLGDPADEYFADGVTEEITTSLARLSGLGVISRTSAMQYKDTDKNLQQIGKELKVDCVLEGTIRWDKSGETNRVRINPQLIRVSDDMHLWANRYDAVLTDVFAVQSSIARDVAGALDVALLQSEQDALTDRPDVNPAAYDYYLRGKQFFSVARYHQKELRTAEKMQLKAIELAPGFALAYAELGSLYAEMNWDGIDTSQTILDSAKVLIGIALNLAPTSPEVYQALGWYYYHGLRDFDKALDAFSRVLQWQPNNSLAIASIAWVERRRGEWDKAATGLHRAVQLDPRESWYHHELGNTYISSRHFEQAIESYDQVIDLEPSNEWAFLGKSWSVLNLTGEPAAALEVIDEGLVYNPQSPSLAYMAAYYHLCDGEVERALSLMTGPKHFYLWQYGDGMDFYYLKGTTLAQLQRTDEAAIYLDSARVVVEAFVAVEPDQAGYQSALGKIYAGLGRKDEAIAAGQLGIELLPVSVDALDGPAGFRDMAIVYTRVGEPDLATDYLDSLLSVPSEVSVNWLKIAPEFLSLRDHPRFKALIEKYEEIHGI